MPQLPTYRPMDDSELPFINQFLATFGQVPKEVTFLDSMKKWQQNDVQRAESQVARDQTDFQASMKDEAAANPTITVPELLQKAERKKIGQGDVDSALKIEKLLKGDKANFKTVKEGETLYSVDKEGKLTEVIKGKPKTDRVKLKDGYWEIDQDGNKKKLIDTPIEGDKPGKPKIVSMSDRDGNAITIDERDAAAYARALAGGYRKDSATAQADFDAREMAARRAADEAAANQPEGPGMFDNMMSFFGNLGGSKKAPAPNVKIINGKEYIKVNGGWAAK